MTDQPTLPPRVCRKGHRVASEDGTGRIRYQSYTGAPYLECVACAALRKVDLARLGLKR